VGLLLGAKTAGKRNLLLMALSLEVSTVVLSYSRGGAVTLGVIMLLYLWKLRRRSERSWLWGLILAGVMLLPFAPSSYFDRLSTITNVEADRTGSAQERWGDMVVAARTIVANPFIGAGIGMNTLAMKEARGGWLPVHNVYLEHALDLGLLGLILFLLLWYSCLKATIAAQRSYEELGLGDMRLLAEGLQISLIAYATAAMFHPVSYHPYFYYMAGLAVAAWKICPPARSATEVHR
jgi:putative inorganic carbon (hco3(-)) transporter